jgi:hypothetical protein
MFDHDDEDDEFIESSLEEMERKMLTEKAKQEFVEGCYQAYDMLIEKGPKALEEAEISSIKNAMNRMAALFILKEEYERCNFLKQFASNHIKGFSIVPDSSVYQEMKS